MRLLFLSDIHGSPANLLAVTAWLDAHPVEQIILLGDLLYHGPRNRLTEDYAPPSVVDILNGLKEKLIAVRGNCDCEVDQMLLQFPMLGDYSTLLADGQRFFLSHGHVWNPGNPPPIGTCSVLCYGHTHIPELRRDAGLGLVYFNPGSLSLPKGGFPPSYGLYEDRHFAILEAGRPDHILASLDLPA